MFFAAVVGWPVPLLAIQILWINLVTDGLPALALGTEPLERDIMSRAPRPPHEAVITREHGRLIFFHGTLIAAVAGLGFRLICQGDEMDLNRARKVAFCVTAFAQIFFAIGCCGQPCETDLSGTSFRNGHCLLSINRQLRVACRVPVRTTGHESDGQSFRLSHHRETGLHVLVLRSCSKAFPDISNCCAELVLLIERRGEVRANGTVAAAR